MPDHSPTSPAGPAGGADARTGRGDVRNVALVGHTGAGKTTLVEALLVAAGIIHRAGNVPDGTTVCDHDAAEHRQQRSIGLAVAPVRVADVTVNLLDTPGYADFVGELRAGLRAADAALFVVSAAEPIDDSTRLLWAECASVGMPRAVVVTKLDHPRADFVGTVQACRDTFDAPVLPAYLPLASGEAGPTALMGMITSRVLDHASGTRVERDPTDEETATLETARAELIEGVIEEAEDEALLDRYLAGEDIDPAELIADLERAVVHGTFHPVVPVCANSGLGAAELLDFIVGAFPAPQERPVPEVTTVDGRPRDGFTADPDGPLVAEIVKTTTDPYVGRVSLLRMFAGTLRPDDVVHVSGHFLTDRGHDEHDEDERIGALSAALGTSLTPVSSAPAGHIVAVAKLSRAETGDTLSGKDDPLLMRPWTMPDPLLPMAVAPRSKADDDKLAQGMSRLAAEDPTLRIENNAETHQLVLWTMGEAHADVLLDRLASRYGVEVNEVELRIPLRETVRGAGTGLGRHVKQSGGHGQYGVCSVAVEPLPTGAGFEFVDKVVGGAVPRQFIPSVEKGVRAQLAKGASSAGYPMVDIRVTLHDGKAHSVDSSDMAFQTAGALALRDAAANAGVVLLEPLDEVEVLIPDEFVGAVLGDLSGRRGRVLGTESVGGGRTLVRADVPATEIVRYAIHLRSFTHGAGTFSRRFTRYDEMPATLVSRVLESA